jgi:ribosomal 50S subunit-recycling heat shock protein
MRIDKFLNSVNLTKRRSIAQDIIVNGVVSIIAKVVKPSKDVSVGDIISIAYLSGEKKYQVLSLPTIKATPKSEQDKYIKEVA